MPDMRRIVKSALIDARKLFSLFRRLDREAVAAQFIRGSGIEIGALHNPLKLPSGAKVRYVDRMPVADLRAHYPELAGRNLVHVDIVDDGEKLATVPDGSQDFVIANHFLEHCEDPLRTLQNHLRVITSGGVLFVTVPDKRYTFDLFRQVTPFEHVERDFREGPAWSRDMHYLEWAEHVERISEPAAIRARADELQRQSYSIHFHVWIADGLVEFVHRMRALVLTPFSVECIIRNEGEVTIVLRRMET